MAHYGAKSSAERGGSSPPRNGRRGAWGPGGSPHPACIPRELACFSGLNCAAKEHNRFCAINLHPRVGGAGPPNWAPSARSGPKRSSLLLSRASGPGGARILTKKHTQHSQFILGAVAGDRGPAEISRASGAAVRYELPISWISLALRSRWLDRLCRSGATIFNLDTILRA